MNKLRVPLMIAAALLTAFLLGFLLGQYRLGTIRSQLESEQRTTAELRITNEMGELRDLAALMYVELSRKNFGLASQHAERYFREATQLARSAPDPETRAVLATLVDRRDAVTAALAATDPTAFRHIENLYFETYRATHEKAE